MELAELDELYRGAILDHCRNPRHPDKLEEADLAADGVNPFCGDEIHLQVRLDGQCRVARAGFQGVGCFINRASGSMLADAIRGKTLEEIEAVSILFGRMMQGDALAEQALKGRGDLRELSGVRRFPVRVKCALLAWSALEEGIQRFRRNHSSDSAVH